MRRAVTPVRDLGHDALASDLANWLRMAYGRVAWENMSFTRYTEGQPGRRRVLAVRRPDVFSIESVLSLARARPYVHEVKVSRADLMSDLRTGKWEEYYRWAGHVWFACPEGLVRREELPAGAGLVVRTDRGWAVDRRASPRKYWSLEERDLLKMVLGRWGQAPEHEKGGRGG